MIDEKISSQFQKQKNNQNLNEKSRVLKLFFSAIMTLSTGLIKEVINSKSNLED